MKMKIFVASAFLAAIPMIGSAATVINGGFEMDPGRVGERNGNTFGAMPGMTGNFSWDIWDSVDGFPGWSTNNYPTDGIELQTRGTLSQIDPYSGDYYAELDTDSNSSIWQDIFLDVGDYYLEFAYSPRVNTPDGPGTNGISFGVGTLLTGMANGPDAGDPWGQWTEYKELFTVSTAGTYRLFFDATTLPDSLGGLLDDIRINEVPVPAAGFLLLGGLGGLAALKRRKKA